MHRGNRRGYGGNAASLGPRATERSKTCRHCSTSGRRKDWRPAPGTATSFADVVKLNYYLTDISQLPVARAVRDEYVDTARSPASTAVQVSALAMPGLEIEIEAWAICAD